MLTVFGDRDGRQYEKLMTKLPATRAKEHVSALLPSGAVGTTACANNLLMLLFDAAICHRLGKPDEPLRSFSEERGWLGDVSKWKAGNSTIAPFMEYQGRQSEDLLAPRRKNGPRMAGLFCDFQAYAKAKKSPGFGRWPAIHPAQG